MKRICLTIAVALSSGTTVPQSVVTNSERPANVSDWQGISEPGPTEAVGFRHFCQRISYAEAAKTAPLPLDLTPISADQPAFSSLGALEYTGRGVEIRSDDPRFNALEIAPGRALPRMPDGDFIEVYNYVPYDDDTRPARCFAPWNRPLSYPGDVAPIVPTEVYDQLQALPDLRLIGAAPLGLKAWLALTQPNSEPGRTLLVRVQIDRVQPPEVVAELPFNFQVIEPVVDFHSARRWVRLAGRGNRDEPIRVMLLEVPAYLF